MKGNFFYKRLGERVISERKKRNMSQEELALDSHMDRTYLARIEEGKANPTIKVLNKLARQFKIPLSELLEHV
jgi:transcriptional regulator with XRE-family HTH domain